mmetsp:Transcript_18339/g.30734  ORF Transcript_18339/g.30734 Transcript_18339/m.30734 type:complete len:162 (+) Transcript_18339:103-588(+)
MTEMKNDKGSDEKTPASPSWSMPSFDDLKSSFDGLKTMYENFSLHDNVTKTRAQINDMLAKVPAVAIPVPEVDEKMLDAVKGPLYEASEYTNQNYPYVADLARSHGKEITGATTVTVALMLHRMPRQLFWLTTLTALVGTAGAVTAINFKWLYPKTKKDEE